MEDQDSRAISEAPSNARATIKLQSRRGTIAALVACLLLGCALIAAGLGIPVLSPSKSCELEIRTTPAGAMVFLDGQLRGTAPVKLSGVNPGIHQIRVMLPGYRLMEAEFQVMNQTRDVMDWTLVPVHSDSGNARFTDWSHPIALPRDPAVWIRERRPATSPLQPFQDSL